MADKKVISIRFHMDSKEDVELYKYLEKEAGATASLASVVKAKIRDSYNKPNNSLQDSILAVIREEMQELCMKLVGAVFSGMVGMDRVNGTITPKSVVDEGDLPEKSEKLPSGALDFLE